MKTFTANDLNLIKSALGAKKQTAENQSDNANVELQSVENQTENANLETQNGENQGKKTKEEVYHFEVVTPMFGGGVEAGVNDETKLIRETEIRGHLRFWWRATVGADINAIKQSLIENGLYRREQLEELKDSKVLHIAESRIWGDTKTPSKVTVRVFNIGKGSEKEVSAIVGNTTKKLGYVLFPYVESDVPGKGRENVKFDLQIIYPADHEKDVKAALWAWANFGGIGARTRRGCGALFCKIFAPKWPYSCSDQSAGLNQMWNDLSLKSLFSIEATGKKEWPTLRDVYINYSAEAQNPPTIMNAWERIVDEYKQYRQNTGRKRSNWPEADALRSKVGFHYKDPNNANHNHAPITGRPAAFPKMELGAPIVFKFKDDQCSFTTENGRRKYRDAVNREPAPRTIYPLRKQNEGGKFIIKTRMASPFIIRPIVFKNKKAFPGVIFFNANEPDGATFREAGVLVKEDSVVDKAEVYDVITSKSAEYQDSPLSASSAGSALAGFKEFLSQNGYMTRPNNDQGNAQ